MPMPTPTDDADDADDADMLSPLQAGWAEAGDAIELLSADHDETRRDFELYAQLVDDGADAGERAELASDLCLKLMAHMAAEEAIFYPALRSAIGAEDLLDEATVEHASARDLIEQILSMGPDEPLYDARMKVLSESIEHHVREEEGELFPQARQARGLDLVRLGEQIAERKAELMEAMDAER